MRKSLPKTYQHFVNPDETHYAMADELRPVNRLADDELEIWDDLAPLLAMNQRLKPLYKLTLILLCKAISSEHSISNFLIENGDTYESSGARSGIQIKMRPQVGQLNEIRRVIGRYVGDFGLTPAAEKQLMIYAQTDMFDKHNNPFHNIDDATSEHTLQ